MNDEIQRVTVSRDALRADLAEMELRLRVFIQNELANKASQTMMEKLEKDVDIIRDSLNHLTVAQKLEVKELIDAGIANKDKMGFSRNQRIVGTITLVCVIIGLFFTGLYTIHEIESPSNLPSPSLNTGVR